MNRDPFSFDALVAAIEGAHTALAAQASKAVNISLTLRNWLIGCYIHEYEQAGADRAAYGGRLLDSLAGRLQGGGLKRVDARELRRFRQFYLVYPQIRVALPPELPVKTSRDIRETPSPKSPNTQVPALHLLERLSFSHFTELLQMADSAQRNFYEIEALRGSWSVRELKRQIATQYYQRSGLSSNQPALAHLTQTQAQSRTNPIAVNAFIRDPYVFEFLGLESREVVTEGQLEDALLDRLQNFLLELGHGFCFEARQKRLLIGGEHFFVDLVFYHRVLKCHVLIELKNDAFQHQHLGQLNTYVSYYQQHEMSAGDQPPIGILLCTTKNHELVEFALAGMANQLFVSRYQVQLPDKAQMAAFLQQAVRELREGGWE